MPGKLSIPHVISNDLQETNTYFEINTILDNKDKHNYSTGTALCGTVSMQKSYVSKMSNDSNAHTVFNFLLKTLLLQTEVQKNTLAFRIYFN